MIETYQIPVTRHVQRNYNVYMGHMTARQAKLITFADHYPAQKGRLGYQRPPDHKRAQSFARYLIDDPSAFLTPLLLNAREPLQFAPDQAGSCKGTLHIPARPLAAKVDGQHRGLGVEEYLGDPDFVVPFMLIEQLDAALEQKLFITINREQKRVSMSHVHFIEGDPLSELATRLESDQHSPWYHQVNLVGARGTKRPVSLRGLRDALFVLLQSGEVKACSQDDQYDIARDFWATVARVWPEAWIDRKTSLLTKSMCTLAVAKLGGFLVPQCLVSRDGRRVLDAEKLCGYLRKAADVDWSRRGPFGRMSGRGGADGVKDYLDHLIFGADRA